LFSSFQEIQHLSALQAAIRILPSLVVGVILNFSTGLLVHKIPAMWIVIVSSILTAGAPLLMAVIQPEWTYWANAFFAQILMPISADVLFTVGLIVITDVFPEDKQAVAGAVFNTGAQFGNAFGLAVMQAISTLVSKEHRGEGGMDSAHALMQGYRACFWTMFAMMLSCAVIGAVGLRKTGKIGLKMD
jgi:MFS family permease